MGSPRPIFFHAATAFGRDRETLSKPPGAAFDRASVDHEVVYHQLLDAIDKVLLPNAKTPNQGP